MQRSVVELLDLLDGYRDPIPLPQLAEWLRELDVAMSELEPWMRFAPERYQRNLLRDGPAYHALLLCWSPGQRSPIHDHRSSRCAFLVLKGTATESVFARTARGAIYPTHSRTLPVGSICSSFDADIHQISNLAESDDLVTLHIYSPPLMVMGQYTLMSEDAAEYIDPVFEFSSGGGI